MAILPVQLLFHPTISLLNGLGHFHVARPNSVPTFSFFFTDSNKFLCKISRLTSADMFSSIRTRFPTLDDEKEPQHFTFPPPCLTVGTVYLESNASCGVRQTMTLPSEPSKLNLLSLVHST